MSDFNFTSEQETLLNQISKWFHDYESGHRIRNHPQWFSYSGAAGTGKAIPDDELLPTLYGMRYAKDLQVGDYLFNANGEPTRILGVYPQKPDMTYKLTFTDGRTARCCIEHLWPLYNRKTGKFIITPLKDFIGRYQLGPRVPVNGKHSDHVLIPAPGPCDFKDQYLPIDPWVLGVFIGNGCLREKPLTISCENEIIPNMIAIKYGYTVKRNSLKNYNWCFKRSDGSVVHTDEFFNDLPELIGKYSHDKYIPSRYLFNTIESRMDLLAGLLDTDGYIDSVKYRIRYSTVSKMLCDDIVFLARSLGLRCNYGLDIREKYKTGVCYNISISCKAEIKPYLFKYPRKHAVAVQGTYKAKELRYDLLTLNAIEEDGVKPLRCFYVEDPTHLYITGEFVPTHNTTVVKGAINRLNLSDDQYITCAYTGKAALNLQQKNLPSCTVHSLIYHTIIEKVTSTDDEIDQGAPPVKIKFHFILKASLPKKYRLIIVDEATMINNDMRDKILGFGLPTIFVGDMNQLPPIFGVSDVMLHPDFVLTKIMRQSEGNPIIQLSQMILNDDYYDFGNYGESKVVDHIDFDKGLIKDYDMILCGKNKTRDTLNNRIIREILGRSSLTPFIGAKVVNRQNNWDIAVDGISLTNGLVGYITNLSKRQSYKGYYTIDFRPDFMDSEFEGLHIDTKYIVSDYEARKNFGLTKFEKFEYAYCISTHISQGSQYNRVLFLDEPFYDIETTKKLRYTAITRAIDKITIVRSEKSYTPRTMWNSEAYNNYRKDY